VDELFREFHESGYYAVGYADRIAILINGREILKDCLRGNTNV
jgi:hypothetical protein